MRYKPLTVLAVWPLVCLEVTSTWRPFAGTLQRLLSEESQLAPFAQEHALPAGWWIPLDHSEPEAEKSGPAARIASGASVTSKAKTP
jgi:hypothetical protein